MNVHAAALAKAHRFDEQTSAFAHDVIEGLSQQPKRLSPKYFYDAAGSELFEQITVLPEYYPTRTELGILRDRASEIAAIIPEGAGSMTGCVRPSTSVATYQIASSETGRISRRPMSRKRVSARRFMGQPTPLFAVRAGNV